MLRAMFAILATLTLVDAAVAKCRYDPDPLKNCGDAISDWWNGNASHQSPSPQDVEHRTEGLRDVAKDCADCATDQTQSGADQATSSTTDTDISRP